MHFIQFAIRNPVKVAVGVILAVLFGSIAYLQTPVQLTPDVEEPLVTVTTRWPGASPQEVEQEIIDKQEEQLKSVEGMREFKSNSSNSTGTITLKFEVGANLSDAAARVRDKLSQVPEYPIDADEPTITTVDPNANAIAWFILRPIPPTPADLEEFARVHPEAREALADLISGERKIELSVLKRLSAEFPDLNDYVEGKNSPARMRKFAEDNVKARFERVPGIANSNVLGGQEEEVRVVVNPARLAAYQVTLTDLQRVLLARNKNVSGGDIWESKTRSEVRTLGQFTSLEQIEETIIATRRNSPVRVKDVARVELNYKKPDGIVRQKGVISLAINAQQAPGTNLIEIMGPPREVFDTDGDGQITALELEAAERKYGNCLRLAVEQLNQGVLKQRGVFLEQVYDQTEYLHSARQLVVSNIYIGGALAIGVLLIFLRSPRSVLIIGLSIPICVVATFLFVKGFGRSINVISLAGMAFAVGMVVDNAIVVLENIFRHYQSGDEPEEAAAKGTSEVWGAVLASTLTTMAVFIPVIFVQGQAGQLFRDIAIAISCAVGLSLVISITVIPTAARKILRRHGAGETKIDAGFVESPDDPNARLGFFGRINLWFADFIYQLMTLKGGWVLRVAVVVMFVFGSLAGAWLMNPRKEFLPDGNQNLVFGMLFPPPGYNAEKLMHMGDDIEQRLAPYWEIGLKDEAGKDLADVRIDNFFFVARGRMLFMGARSTDPLKAGNLVPILREAASTQPGVFAVFSQRSIFESGLQGGRTIDLEITGPDLETLYPEAKSIFFLTMQVFPPTEGHQISPEPGLDLSSPELHVIPNWEKASELGLSATELGYSVNALVDGAYAGDYRLDGEEIDLVIYGADEYAIFSEDVGRLPIATPSGSLVSLSAVADLSLRSGPDQVAHIERQRSVTIKIKPAPGMALETALEIVNREIRDKVMERPTFSSGLYQINLAGTADKLSETAQELQWNLALALVITYLLMAALFESFFYPLIIMTSVLLALVGGLFGLQILKLFIPQALDMLTMLGFVILIGTVVNNPILIVHQALNLMRAENMEPRLAIRESVRTRVRPIFMSTLTTLLGMLPLVVPMPSFSGGKLAFVAGAGTELYRGLGSVVLGGLLVSTMFTLILVPVGFSLALEFKMLVTGALRRLLPRREPEPAWAEPVFVDVPSEALASSEPSPIPPPDATPVSPASPAASTPAASPPALAETTKQSPESGQSS